MFNKINNRTQERVKHCNNCYLTIKSILYQQWTDATKDKADAIRIKNELIKQGYKSIVRFVDDSFYRVYREVKIEGKNRLEDKIE
jgi:hypothetical protein